MERARRPLTAARDALLAAPRSPRERDRFCADLLVLADSVVPSHAAEREEEMTIAAGDAFLKLTRLGLQRLEGLSEAKLRGFLRRTLRNALFDAAPDHARRHALAQHVRKILLRPPEPGGELPEALSDESGRVREALVMQAIAALLAAPDGPGRSPDRLLAALLERYPDTIRTRPLGAMNEDGELDEELDPALAVPATAERELQQRRFHEVLSSRFPRGARPSDHAALRTLAEEHGVEPACLIGSLGK